MPQLKRTRLARVPAPEQRVYANIVTVHAGGYDVALDYGFQVGDGDPEGLVRVSMSYEHLASAVKLMQRLLDQYTETVGPVPDPDQRLRELEEAGGDA